MRDLADSGCRTRVGLVGIVLLGSACLGNDAVSGIPSDAAGGGDAGREDVQANRHDGARSDGHDAARADAGGLAGDARPAVDSSADAASVPDGGSPTACGVPFSGTGPWCYKLPASTPVDPSSAAIIANIQSDITNNYGDWGLNTDTYSTPIYEVPPATPMETWGFDDCQHKGSLPASFAPAPANVPTAAGMVSSMGTDAEITIYEPSADQEWEFWVATDTMGQWSACWGGTIQHVSTDPGIFEAGSGATASGLPLLGYVVRIAELQAGLIAHAINVELVRTQATQFSWPANRTDGNTADPTILMEGQRLRLDPTFDVSTLPNAAERTIATAMQDYGILLTDTSGAVVTQLEDERPYMTAHGTTTNPYDAIFAGRPSYQVLAELPVARLQALPKDYGQTFLH